MQVFLKTGSSFFAWWIASVKSTFDFKKNNKVELRASSPSIFISSSEYILKNANDEALEFGSLESLISEMKNSPSLYKKMDVLAFDESRYLYRKLSDSYLPDYRIHELAVLDLISQTPFEHEDVFIIPDSCNGRGKGYYILKKSILNPALNALKSVKLKPKFLSFHSLGEINALPFQSISNIKKTNFFSRNLMAIFAILVFVFGAITFAHFQVRYETAADELDVQIATISKDVKEVRSIIANQRELSDRLSNVLDLKNNASSTIEVWEEFSRILPDSSWLSVLKISEDKITASGYSRNAASLIEIIDGSTLFADAGFDGPVVAIPGKDIQRFAIQVRLEK